MKFAAIIFDMDGVLADTEPLHCAVDRSLLGEEGIVVTDGECEASAGLSERDFFLSIAGKRGFPPQKADEWLRRKARIFDQTLQTKTIPAIDGVAALVRSVAKRFPCAVASSSRREVICAILGKTGLSRFFNVRVSSDDLPPGRGKPHPDIYLLAAEKLKADPKRCLVIEDAAHGVRAAKAAGMFCIGFRSPNSGEQDLSEADMVVERMEEIPPLLSPARRSRTTVPHEKRTGNY